MPNRRDPETGLCLRGSSNSNERGSSKARRERKQWLLETYRADVDVLVLSDGSLFPMHGEPLGTGTPACRCYRCGDLLIFETLTVDRIFPKKHGGIYSTVRRDKREKRTNLRPACADCNSETGGALARGTKIKVVV